MPLMKNLRVFLAKNGENNVCGKNPLCLAAIAIINKNMRENGAGNFYPQIHFIG